MPYLSANSSISSGVMPCAWWWQAWAASTQATRGAAMGVDRARLVPAIAAGYLGCLGRPAGGLPAWLMWPICPVLTTHAHVA